MIRVLHTSDWHLGKSFEGTDYSLLGEQRAALEEMVEIVGREGCHLVVVAGDVFDHYHPSASAQRLFYDALAELSEGGRRPVVVVAGNHDSPEGLTSARALLEGYGLVIAGRPGEPGRYDYQGPGFSVKARGPQLRLDLPQGSITLFLLPYPSEVRFPGQGSLETRLKGLAALGPLGPSDLLVGHLFLERGQTAGSERQIIGDLALIPRHLLPPAKIMALGHLHRYQRLKGACYSGSIFPLSREEARLSPEKFFSLIDIDETGSRLSSLPIDRPRKVALITVEDHQEALRLADQYQGQLVFLEVSLPPAGPEAIERLKKAYEGRLLGLRFAPPPASVGTAISDTRSLDDRDLFVEFYRRLYEKAPPEALVDLFVRMMEGVSA
ncbi:exonuclease SbcCD subunit D [Thermosulfuriphilus sp.]